MIDVGTGDGRAAIERARREPQTLVVGLDANAAGMAEVSRRAAASSSRGGVPNAMFVAAAAEHPPAELFELADEVTVQFPWGSLLRGALALDDSVAAGLAALVRPGGRLVITISIADRDGLGLPSLDEPREVACLAERWSGFGLDLTEIRSASGDELRSTRSSWARRLAAGGDRPVWRFELTARTSLTPQRTDLRSAGRILER